MGALDILLKFGKERYWTDEDMLDICLEYIDNQCDEKAFEDFVSQHIAEEDEEE